MGIHADSLPAILEQNKQDVFLIDLDNNSVSSPVQLPEYPDPEISTLMTDLKKLLNSELMNLDTPTYNPFSSTSKTKNLAYGEINEQIQCCFLKFFSTLFREYRQYLLYVRVFPNPVAIFDSSNFIELRPQNKVMPWALPLMNRIFLKRLL